MCNMTFFERGAFPAEGVLLTCNMAFFERGCFSSRGGTDMHATGCAIIILPKYYY